MARRPPAEPVPHALYYRKDQAGSMEVLRFVSANKNDIRAMNVKITPRAVPAQGADPRLINYLRSNHVTQIPALVTPSGVHLGARAIIRIYQENLRGLAQKRQQLAQQQQAAAAGGGGGAGGEFAGDDLASYYAKMIKAEADEDEPVGGGGFDPQAEMAKLAQRRAQFGLKSSGKAPRMPPTGGGGGGDGDPYNREGGTGEDSTPIGMGAFDQTFSKALSDDPQDNLMMEAFLNNLTET